MLSLLQNVMSTIKWREIKVCFKSRIVEVLKISSNRLGNKLKVGKLRDLNRYNKDIIEQIKKEVKGWQTACLKPV